MGYTVHGTATFTLKPGGAPAAIAALKAWGNEQPGQIPWGSNERLQEANTLAECWAAIGFEVGDNNDPATGCEIYHGDSWAQEYDDAASALAPFVIADESPSEWEGEEGETWQWRWNADGTKTDDYAEHFYEEDRTKAAADAAALDELAALVALPEWRIDDSATSWIEAAAEIIGKARPAASE